MLEPLLWEMLKAAHNQALLNLCTSTAMVDCSVEHPDLSTDMPYLMYNKVLCSVGIRNPRNS